MPTPTYSTSSTFLKTNDAGDLVTNNTKKLSVH